MPHQRKRNVARPRALALAITVSLLATPSIATSVARAQGQAAGRPYVDCVKDSARVQQLRAGLRPQEEAIRRTEAQMNAALIATTNARADARQKAVDAARSEVQGLIGEYLFSLNNKVKALQALGVSRADRRQLLQQLQRAEEYWSNASKLIGSGTAGYQTGVELRSSTGNLAEEARRLNDLFVRSGVAEELGETISAGVGPFGPIAFKAARLGIDIGVAVAEGSLSAAEYTRALQHLDLMKYHHGRVMSEINRLEALMQGEGCGRRAQRVAESPRPVPPPPPVAKAEPKDEPKVVKQEPEQEPKKDAKKGGVSSDDIYLGLSVATGALYAASYLAKEEAGSSGNCASSRNCIISLSGSCDCAGSVNSGPCEGGRTLSDAGGPCPCKRGLSCNNGRCEGANGRCPF